MSAVPSLQLHCRAMQARDVDAVMAVERLAYDFPWTAGNFLDSLSAGYEAELALDARGDVAAYRIAMVGVDEMHLPNPDLSTAAGRDRHLAPLEPLHHAVVALAAAERGSTWREALDLHVHDAFLWRLLHPGASERGGGEHGGCQAGGARAFVDGSGNVLACNAMPIRIGSLLTSSLADLWSLPTRDELRAHIEATAPGCDGCALLAGCRGGCRGHAWLLSRGRFDALDPTCVAVGAHPGNAA